MGMIQETKLPAGVRSKIQSGGIKYDADGKGFMLVHNAANGNVEVYSNGQCVLRLTDPVGFGAPTMAVHAGDGKLWVEVWRRDPRGYGETMVRAEVDGWAAFETWKSG